MWEELIKETKVLLIFLAFFLVFLIGRLTGEVKSDNYWKMDVESMSHQLDYSFKVANEMEVTVDSIRSNCTMPAFNYTTLMPFIDSSHADRR